MDNTAQMAHLAQLLQMLQDRGIGKIDPSNFPQMQLGGLEQMLSKNNPGVAADMATSGGFPVNALQGLARGGKLEEDNIAQLYQLITGQLRGMGGR